LTKATFEIRLRNSVNRREKQSRAARVALENVEESRLCPNPR